MSLGDSFAAALAKQKKADLYTGDPEFKAVEKDIKIIWLYRSAGLNRTHPSPVKRPT